jgi:hypothetical protein
MDKWITNVTVIVLLKTRRAGQLISMPTKIMSRDMLDMYISASETSKLITADRER